MRLFVAVLPPAEAVAELDAAVSALHGLPGAGSLLWTDRAGWHLTLAFLGEVEDDALPELEERLARAAGRHQPMPLRLAGGGRFGDRALWTGLDRGRAELARLARSAAAAARRTGVPVDERPFKAHLTLARARRERVDLRPFAEALALFTGASWDAGPLRLMSSAPGGPGRPNRYETVRSWPLGRA
ncbi:RNA 2',3'-cyclic phosphodiesterase [Streptomyces capparidis]